jgi:hypothetical protein
VTNRIAFPLAGLLVALLALDLALGLGGSLFLARRFIAVLDWMAFWR